MKNKIIEAKQLCKTYILGKQGTNVLKNIDLDIYHGDFTVIMGSSGCGKSTLLYALSSMDKPSSGEVKVLGKDITKMGEVELCELRKRDISFVFQSINLLNDLTTYENITYMGFGSGKKDDIKFKAERLIKDFNLINERDKYPSEMSGGQKQKVAMCRALIGSPKIIFGDEPTGALNSSSGKEVLDILTNLNKKGQSILMVTHDLKVAIRADRLLYMCDGRIQAEMKLEKYSVEKHQERQNEVFKFLEEQGW